MDNITHAFAGAAIAECALPAGASAKVRRVFMLAGVVAASAPDLDLVYTWITEAPLGYMLHHRGHTHTWPGLLVLGGLLVAALHLWPAGRQALAESRNRLLAAIAAGLVSHLLMDASNSYGTHLLYPFSSAWYYGDAVFILEPWVWLLLGTALALNARGRLWRALILVMTSVPIAGLTFIGMVTPAVATALLLGGAAVVALGREWSPPRRAGAALAAIAVLFVTFAGLSRIADGNVRRALGGGELVDLVLDPNPGAPWCWSVLTVELSGQAPNEELVARRGTLSLLPGLVPAASCASHRLFGEGGEVAAPASEKLAWKQEWRTDLARLRALDQADCRTSAWLQFGRAPYATGDRIADLRYENPVRDNFSAMTLGPPSAECPANLTRWEKPRQDLLGSD